MTKVQDPFKLFSLWYEEAKKCKQIEEVNTMNLATSSWNGFPSNRMILLNDFSDKGFAFYADPHSRRGEELNDNPRASLCFSWEGLKRQVRIEGNVVLVSDGESDEKAQSKYNVIPCNIEFWQKNDSDAYDKILYKCVDDAWENEIMDAQNADTPVIARPNMSA